MIHVANFEFDQVMIGDASGDHFDDSVRVCLSSGQIIDDVGRHLMERKRRSDDFKILVKLKIMDVIANQLPKDTSKIMINFYYICVYICAFSLSLFLSFSLSLSLFLSLSLL